MNLEESKSLIDPRLSSAYPPNSIANSQYLSECHQKLKEALPNPKLHYRQVAYRKDIQQLKVLHKEWFPIDYSASFYELVFKNPQNTLLAEVEVIYKSGIREKIIVGCIVFKVKRAKGEYIEFTHCLQRLALMLRLNDANGVYIMTLGVINEFRGMGVAQHMLNYLKGVQFLYNNDKNNKEWTRQKVQINYVYLDMVTYNEVAGRFYEKNGFNKVRTKYNYYTIEGIKHNAYVYIWYPNDKQVEQNINILECLLIPMRAFKLLINKLFQR